MNNQMKVLLIDDKAGVSRTDPTSFVYRSAIGFGGTRRKPCIHDVTVCASCLKSWSWDYWCDITPGIVSTFINRYGAFPKDVLFVDDDGTLVQNPESHLRITNVPEVIRRLTA